jgi:hypothetical protein
MTRTIAAAILACAIATAVHANEWGKKSALLDLGMTEDQVKKVTGQGPTKVEMQVCGALTRDPWKCKIHTYGDRLGAIMKVYFQQYSDSSWRVHSWDVY